MQENPKRVKIAAFLTVLHTDADSSRTKFEPKNFRTMKSTFSTIFYLKRQVMKKDGTVPVMGRITVDGTQTQFSCKLSVDPKLWDTKGGRVTGRSTAALITCDLIKKK